MRYARYAGDDHVDRPGAVLARAVRFGGFLKWPALGAFAATILATTARLLGPLAVRFGIDDGIAAGDKGFITRAALAFIGLLAVQYTAQRVASYAVAWLGERYLRELRVWIYRHLMNLDMAFFDRSKAGVLVSRMTTDMEAISQFANEGAVLLVTNVLTVVGVAVAMLFVDVQLALAVFAVIPVLVVASAVFRRYAERAYREVREQIGRVLASLQEGISGVRVVQAFTQEASQAAAFGRVNEDHYRANMRAARAIAWYFPSVDLMRTVGTALVLIVGGTRVLDGNLTFGSLVVFLMYLDWFFEPIVSLSNIYNLLQSALAGFDKLFGLKDTQPAVGEKPGAYDVHRPVRGEVRFDGVSFGYGDEPAVRDIDLTVPAGRRLAVVGETGAGKSTLAKLAIRFYDPTDGRVLLDGVDLRDLTLVSLRRTVAVVPQEGFLFSGSLRDNLRYAVPDAGDDRLWEACEALSIDGWVRSLPERLDTQVRERGSRFSSGERQLVALARALLADPSVIVLDEATSNLDPETEAAVEKALTAVLRGRTAIVVAHRLRSAERADEVVVVDEGRIVERGHHRALRDAGGVYTHLVEVWEQGTARTG